MASMIPPIPDLSGMTPQQQLDAWRQWKMSVDPTTTLGGVSKGSAADKAQLQATIAAMTPEQQAFYNGPNPRPGDPRFLASHGGTYSDAFSPEAEQAFVNSDTHYNVQTGQTEKNKGVWDLPETYGILAAAGGVAAPYIIPAIAGAGGGGGAVSGGTAATTAGGGAATGGGLTAGGVLKGIQAGISAGQRLANLMQSGTGPVDPRTGLPTTDPRAAALAGQANALTNQRFTQTQIDQRGPAVDAQALKNQLRAGLISRMSPNAPTMSVGQYQLPNLNPTQGSVDFAGQFANELQNRLKNKQSLTLSGVPPASQAETDATNRALDAAGIGSGLSSKIAGIGAAVNQGSQLANLGLTAWDQFKKLSQGTGGGYDTVGPPLPSNYLPGSGYDPSIGAGDY